MSDYAKLKKLDEESLEQLKEGTGPVDQCICSLFSVPEEKKGLAASVKKVFAAIGSGRKIKAQSSVDVPLDKNLGGGLYSTKEVVKRKTSCGKCGCDNEKLVLKHSFANIRITTPDITSICPCPTNCLPDKDKLQNNIQVIVERAQINPSIMKDDIDNEIYEKEKKI